MAVLRQDIYGSRSGSTFHTLSLPSAPLPGSLMVAYVGWRNGATSVNEPTGFIKHADNTAAELGSSVFTRIAQGGDSNSFTVTFNGGTPTASTLYVQEWTGTWATATPAEVGSATSAIATANISIPVTTAGADRLLLYWVVKERLNHGVDWNHPSNIEAHDAVMGTSGQRGRTASSYFEIGVAGSVTNTASWTRTTPALGHVLAFALPGPERFINLNLGNNPFVFTPEFNELTVQRDNVIELPTWFTYNDIGGGNFQKTPWFLPPAVSGPPDTIYPNTFTVTPTFYGHNVLRIGSAQSLTMDLYLPFPIFSHNPLSVSLPAVGAVTLPAPFTATPTFNAPDVILEVLLPSPFTAAPTFYSPAVRYDVHLPLIDVDDLGGGGGEGYFYPMTVATASGTLQTVTMSSLPSTLIFKLPTVARGSGEPALQIPEHQREPGRLYHFHDDTHHDPRRLRLVSGFRRSTAIGHREAESWCPVSDVFNFTIADTDQPIGDVWQTWLVYQDSPCEVIRYKLNVALDSAGYRDPAGNFLATGEPDYGQPIRMRAMPTVIPQFFSPGVALEADLTQTAGMLTMTTLVNFGSFTVLRAPDPPVTEQFVTPAIWAVTPVFNTHTVTVPPSLFASLFTLTVAPSFYDATVVRNDPPSGAFYAAAYDSEY